MSDKNLTLELCKKAVEKYKFKDVRISETGCNNYAINFVNEMQKEDSMKTRLPDWRVVSDEHYTKHVYPEDDWSIEDTMDFFVMGNTNNAYFWTVKNNKILKYSHPDFPENVHGSNTMFAVLKKNFKRFKPSNLAKNPVTYNEMRKYFRNIPYLNKRTKIFNEVGTLFKENGYESFKDFFKNRTKCFDNGNGLVEVILKKMPSFVDNANYKDMIIPINKRAQLLPAMLYERLGEKIFPLDDFNKLTGFADYQVPKSMEMLNILVYSERLKNTIDNLIFIKKDSEVENEIRISTIVACDILTNKINDLLEEQGNSERITNLNIDADLWFAGRFSANNFHLTKTMAY